MGGGGEIEREREIEGECQTMEEQGGMETDKEIRVRLTEGKQNGKRL